MVPHWPFLFECFLFPDNINELQFNNGIKSANVSNNQSYLLFMFSLPKISWVVSGIKHICLHLLPVFYLIQPFSKQFICFDFQKQNSLLPIAFYVSWASQCDLHVNIITLSHFIFRYIFVYPWLMINPVT
jgi:hypothetical protein